jgi:hypothetical protein
MDLDFIDYSVECYKIFNPASIYGGKPPFELVVWMFDKPKYSDQTKFPYYPIWKDETKEYIWVDKEELDDPEYAEPLEKMRDYIRLSDAYPNTPNWPKSTDPQPIEVDDDEDYDDNDTPLSDEEIDQMCNEYNEYVNLEDDNDYDLCTDYYSDPLANFKLLIQSPLNLNYFQDFIDQATYNCIAENDLDADDKEDIQEEILEVLIKKQVTNETNIGIQNVNIIPYVKTIHEALNTKFPITNLVGLLVAANYNGKQMHQKIQANKGLRQIVELVPGNSVVEIVQPFDHLKYYFKDDASIRVLLDYIVNNHLDMERTFIEILTDKWFSRFEPSYSPTSPTNDAESSMLDEGPFRNITDDHIKMGKIFSFCISYLACRLENFEFNRYVASSICNKMHLGRTPVNYFANYRKRYKFIFIKDSYHELIKQGCLSFFIEKEI